MNISVQTSDDGEYVRIYSFPGHGTNLCFSVRVPSSRAVQDHVCQRKAGYGCFGHLLNWTSCNFIYSMPILVHNILFRSPVITNTFILSAGSFIRTRQPSLYLFWKLFSTFLYLPDWCSIFWRIFLNKLILESKTLGWSGAERNFLEWLKRFSDLEVSRIYKWIYEKLNRIYEIIDVSSYIEKFKQTLLFRWNNLNTILLTIYQTNFVYRLCRLSPKSLCQKIFQSWKLRLPYSGDTLLFCSTNMLEWKNTMPSYELTHSMFLVTAKINQ